MDGSHGARYNQPEVVEAILKHKPKLDLQDKDGWTALKYAARYRKPEVVEAILKHNKPQLDVQSKNAWTALMSAARYNQPEVVEAIRKHKPQLDLQEKTGNTALFLAVQNEHGPDAAAAMVEALLREGAALDLPNFAGRTPLMGAAECSRAAAAEVLLSHGSRPELRSRSGQNAFWKSLGSRPTKAPPSCSALKRTLRRAWTWPGRTSPPAGPGYICARAWPWASARVLAWWRWGRGQAWSQTPSE